MDEFFPCLGANHNLKNYNGKKDQNYKKLKEKKIHIIFKNNSCQKVYFRDIVK